MKKRWITAIIMTLAVAVLMGVRLGAGFERQRAQEAM